MLIEAIYRSSYYLVGSSCQLWMLSFISSNKKVVPWSQKAWAWNIRFLIHQSPPNSFLLQNTSSLRLHNISPHFSHQDFYLETCGPGKSVMHVHSWSSVVKVKLYTAAVFKNDWKFLTTFQLRSGVYVFFLGIWVSLWLLWPIEYDRSDTMWLLRLGRKKPWIFHLVH